MSLIRHIRQSLALKLSIGILLLSIPVFLLSLGALFFQSRQMVKQEATERAVSELGCATERVARRLSIVETATDITGVMVKRHFSPQSLLDYTRRILLVNADIDGCSVSVEPGVFPDYADQFSAYSVRRGDSISTTIEEPYDYFNKIWYKTPAFVGKPCWVCYYDETDTLSVALDGMLASYDVPLYGDDGRLLAVISSDLSLSHLSKVINAGKPHPNSYFVMVDEKGCYFIHPDSTRLFRQTIFGDSTRGPRDDAFYVLGHEMTAGRTGTLSVNVDGRDCVVCYRPVPGTRWSLALVCPEEDILQSYQHLGLIVVPLLVIGLVLILLYCHRAIALTIKPLDKLLRKTKRIAEGQFEEPISHTKRTDALGRLQNSFASMQEFINFHEGSIRYVIERHQQRNQELQEANQQAEEADRQKTAFIQNVTHQIRTPLNIIMGFAQIVGENQGQLPEDERRSIADMMMHNTRMLYRMLVMLYDCSETGNQLAKKIKDTRERTSCNEVARESIDYATERHPNVSIRFETDLPDSASIHTNRLYLMRSLRELLINSAKYSDGQHISLAVRQIDGGVRFIVEDTGPGIAEEHRDKLFIPFAKVDDLSEGLGLGLSLTMSHIVTLGGTMTLDTDYLDGCRFVIDMPTPTS